MTRYGAAAVVAALMSGSIVLALPQNGVRQRTFRGGVNLVQISVVATDANGLPVHGLSKDDFTVTEKGETRPIEGFAEIATPRPSASPFPVTLAKDVSDNVSSRSDRVVVLVLDDSHVSKATDEMKALARRVVNGLGDGTSIGLITSSGYFGMEPTTDRARVLQVIDDFVNRVEPSGKTRSQRIGASAFGPGGDLSSTFADLTMMKANQDVAHMLVGGGPARKAFVWISAGQQGLCPEPPDARKYSAPSSKEHRCYEMLYEMQRANISTYAVDPQQGRDGFLRSVSDETGGIAIRANDLDAGLDRIIGDLNNYYLLGFAPPDPSDTQYREIQVRASRPGVTLRYRRGYTATSPENVNTPKNLSSTAALVAGVLPKTELHLRFSAVPLAPPAKDGSVPVAATVEVHGDATRLTAADGWLRDTLKFSLVAVDLRHKKATSNRVETRDVRWRPTAAPSGETSYAITTQLWLAPGTYQMRASGESKALAASGSVYLVVDVPDTHASPLALSGLLIGYANGARIGALASGDATTLPFLPTLDRAFAATDVLRIRAGVSRAKSVHDVDLTLEVVDSADRTLISTAGHLGAADPPQFDSTLSLTALVPGAYRLRVTAVAGTGRDSRELGILVK